MLLLPGLLRVTAVTAAAPAATLLLPLLLPLLLKAPAAADMLLLLQQPGLQATVDAAVLLMLLPTGWALKHGPAAAGNCRCSRGVGVNVRNDCHLLVLI